jgi:hypothetical protein
MTSILMLDEAGTPQEWVAPRVAAFHLATDSVSWSVGETCKVMRGGTNARTGLESVLELPPIIAIKGAVHASRSFRPLSFDGPKLFQRDLQQCAYCGFKFRRSELSIDHVTPQSRGGRDSWMNCVTACRSCNGLKADRMPEEAKMPLLYLPYVPNRHETFILSGRNILPEQRSFLMLSVPPNSRLHS